MADWKGKHQKKGGIHAVLRWRRRLAVKPCRLQLASIGTLWTHERNLFFLADHVVANLRCDPLKAPAYPNLVGIPTGAVALILRGSPETGFASTHVVP